MTSSAQQRLRETSRQTSRSATWAAERGPKYPQASYYRARYYDSLSGRFLSEDPANFDGGTNFYPYVNNGPTDWFDPVGLQRQKSRKKPKPPVDPCPPEKRCFFNWLDGPLGKLGNDLGTTKTLMFTMAAKEGGWTPKDLAHNMPLNNPFGVNNIKNGEATGNIKYPSIGEAVAAWNKMYGARVRGIKRADDFVYELQHPAPPAHPYNTKSAATYEDDFQDIYDSVVKFMKLCGISP
jgi:RHS repeat-associated protein